MGSDFFCLISSPGNMYSTTQWNTESLSALVGCMYKVLMIVKRPDASFTWAGTMKVSAKEATQPVRISFVNGSRCALLLLLPLLLRTLLPVFDLWKWLVILVPDDSWHRVSVHCHTFTNLKKKKRLELRAEFRSATRAKLHVLFFGHTPLNWWSLPQKCSGMLDWWVLAFREQLKWKGWRERKTRCVMIHMGKKTSNTHVQQKKSHTRAADPTSLSLAVQREPRTHFLASHQPMCQSVSCHLRHLCCQGQTCYFIVTCSHASWVTVHENKKWTIFFLCLAAVVLPKTELKGFCFHLTLCSLL